MSLRKTLVGIVMSLLLGTWSYCQDIPLPNLPFMEDPDVDSSYIIKETTFWSLRPFATFKSQRIELTSRESNTRVTYRPNNPFALGIGFSYRYLLLDFGFGVKFDKENPTDRFDFQGNLVLQQHLFDFTIQRYKGFELQDPDPADSEFRDDIETINVNLDYLYNFNSRRLSASIAIAGDYVQKKSTGSFMLGGYLTYYKLKADSTIVPQGKLSDFNSFGQIRELSHFSFGLSGGYAYSLVLPYNFFLFASFNPGIGLNFGNVEAQEGYDPPVFPVGKSDVRGAFGYTSTRIYSIISYTTDIFLFSLDHQNRFRYNFGRLKLVVGIKFPFKQ